MALRNVPTIYLFIIVVFFIGGCFVCFVINTIAQMYEELLKRKQKITEAFIKSQEQESLIEEMRIKTDHDLMTNLLNRSAFELAINRYFENSAANVGVFIMLDLDNFKSVNDLLGHNKGDDVLRQVAKVLRASFRPHDFIARMGGDEFAVFVPSTIPEQLLDTKIGELLLQLKMNVDGVSISASVGVCGVSNEHSDYQSLYHAADIALLAAKKDGKNTFNKILSCTCLYFGR